MKNEKKEQRVEVTDLSISFAFKSVRVFYTKEILNSENKVVKIHKHIFLKGDKYVAFIEKLTSARTMALKEVLEKEEKDERDRMD